MTKFTNPLANVQIASPCSADWSEMIGDEQKRFCGQCKLNVYNLSEMNKAQAEKLLLTSEGRLCVRFYRRADGTVLTQNCPIGWQAVKRRVSRFAVAAFAIISGFFGGLGLQSSFKQINRQDANQNYLPVLPLQPLEGEEINIEPELPVMGRIAFPVPKENVKQQWKTGEAVTGMLVNSAPPVNTKSKMKRKNY